jgi:hypothetical protein
MRQDSRAVISVHAASVPAGQLRRALTGNCSHAIWKRAYVLADFGCVEGLPDLLVGDIKFAQRTVSRMLNSNRETSWASWLFGSGKTICRYP